MASGRSVAVVAAMAIAAGALSGWLGPSRASSSSLSSPRPPLERSPGYYPPDDPESMSVVTGRRKAKGVSLPLSGGARSMDDLARMLIAGLEARNEKALHACRLTRREFEVICWPEFPESRPITRITAEDAWDLSDPTSHAGAGRTISAYGGHPLTLLRVREDRREEFRNFRLHRGVVIEARDETTGQVVALRFAPSFVERKGRFKVLMFQD